MSRPFVIAVASEKGGVGKTTIATNLAVYLKALREDLPVTIASFDNHFSVDQMFALGPSPERGVADILTGDDPGELAVLGQYGVQYMGSSRRLQQPPHPPAWLRNRLHAAVSEGILILDTRPILDWFTEAGLLAADLVLVPIKDRAALVNAAALRDVLQGAGRSETLWLLPSLVDTRARLNAEVRVHEFLAYAARERDYQVLNLVISKSPKVESLSSGFSSRIRPVLTSARNTAVHEQFRELAEFVLGRFDAGYAVAAEQDGGSVRTATQSLGEQRTVLECPVCHTSSLADVGHFFFDLGSRRRGMIHPDCLAKIYDEMALDNDDDEGHTLALTIDGPGLVGPECCLTLHRCDEQGRVLSSEGVELEGKKLLCAALVAATGRSLDEAYRELVVVNRAETGIFEQRNGDAKVIFTRKRRKITRELHDAGLF